MMEFQEFVDAVFQDVAKKAAGKFEVQIHTPIKNNGMKPIGIAVIEGNGGPCVYLDEPYREYQSGEMQYDEIVDEVFQQLVDSRNALQGIDIEKFKKWENIQGNVRAKLINTRLNRELLKTVPHRMFLDLAVVYYVMVIDRGGEIGMFLIHHGHMEAWGKDEETLYQAAMRNMRVDGDADFFSMETLIEQICGALPTDRWQDTGMYILTNGRKRFGASELLDKGTLRMIADQMGDGFIVLPSSIHECIVLRPRVPSKYEELAYMVQAVNDVEVSEEERLSNHVYAYSQNEDMLKIVA